jgi:Tol biopolymer transport system component
MTRHATIEGVILGTAAYMSPEQAAGKTVDRRSDIWAFGVVLWELLTGRALFEGETVSHVLASVLKDETDLSRLPGGVPDRLLRLIARCLRRDPMRRLQSIGDARVELQEIVEGSGEPVAAGSGRDEPAATGSRWRLVPWLIAAAFAIIALAAAVLKPAPDAGPAVITAAIPAPPGTAYDIRSLAPGGAVLSPDGSKIAFSAQGEDRATRLWVHELATGRSRMLEDTKSAHYPFWSPDSRRVAFFTQVDRKLKTIDVGGGPAMTVCDAVFGKGGSWGPNGNIVFAPGYGTPIHVVSEEGGPSRAVTTIDKALHNSHRHPRFLPDGTRFMFLARGAKSSDSAVMIGSLDGRPSRELIRSITQAELASGHLLFVRDGSLYARPVDAANLEFTGPAVSLADGVVGETGAGAALFSASRNGLLTYHSGEEEAPMALQLLDRSGTVVSQLGDPASFRHPRISPDGTLVAVSRSDTVGDDPDLWIADLANGLWSRFTLDPAEDIYAVWAPDGAGVVFASNRTGPHDLFSKSVGGAGQEEALWSSSDALLPTDITSDGRFVLFDQYTSGESIDLWVFDRKVGEARPLRQTAANETEGGVSPDGRWLAYQSDEAGRHEIYVMPFPDGGRSWQISQHGGMYPRWRSDGRELVYVDLDGMVVAVPTHPGADGFNVGRSQELFRIDPPEAGGPEYGPAPDLERFVVAPAGVLEAVNSLHVIVNWPGRLDSQ